MSTLPALPTRPLSAPAAQQEKLDNQRFAMYAMTYSSPTEERPACITVAEGAAISRRYSTGGGRLAALVALVNQRLWYWQSTRGITPEKALSPEQVQDAIAFFAQTPPVLAAPAPAPVKPTNGNGSTLRQASTSSAQGATTPAESPAPSFEAQRSPATWSVDYLDVDGWPCTLAITAASGNEAVARGRQIVKALKGQGAKPRPSASSGPASASTGSASSDDGPTPECAIHHMPLNKRKSTRGGFFWSCSQKLENGEWCPYKPKGQN